MRKDDFKTYNRRTVSADLNRFDSLAKEDDFIEVSEWDNGEGWDISIGDDKHFSLTYGELKAVNFLTAMLDINTEDNE